MLSLSEFQRGMVAAILAAGPVPAGPVSTGLEVHRNTVRAALGNALRLTFPTVMRLTGAVFFEQLATDYACAHPPHSPILYRYGESFPRYLRLYGGTRGLPYLYDVARFDLAIERAAHQPPGRFGNPVPLDSQVELRLLTGIACLKLDYPADLIRDAIEADRTDTLADVDVQPRARHLALWRGPSGASVRSLSAASAQFLAVLISTGDAQAAVQSAIDCSSAAQALELIQAEILAASCVQLRRIETGGPP